MGSSAADLQRARLLADLGLPDTTALSLADLQQLSDANAAGVLNQIGTLAYAENATGVAIPVVNGSNTLVTGVSVVVPPSNRDIWLEWGGIFQITTAGDGNLQLNIYDQLNALKGFAFATCGAALPIATNTIDCKGRVKVGASAITRTFTMYCTVARIGGALQASVYNTAPLQSWLAAIAR